jgi:hypothetical protein
MVVVGLWLLDEHLDQVVAAAIGRSHYICMNENDGRETGLK